MSTQIDPKQQPRDDGGPVFPILNDGWTRTDAAGMTLRDYFAAKAMQALMQEVIPGRVIPSGKWEGKSEIELCAHDAYRVSDAMLAARAK